MNRDFTMSRADHIPPAGLHCLAVENLSVTYPSGHKGNQAVSDITLRLPLADSLCLVGSSGAGKSTILSALLGLLPPSTAVRGTVTLPGGLTHLGTDNEQLREYRRHSIGVIFQDPVGSLAPGIPMLRQVASAYRVRHRLSRRDAVVQARSALVQVGLPDEPVFHNAVPAELSGGMNQRVCVALALSAPSLRLLLADEPTSNLDSVMAAQILDLILQVQREHQAALVFVTHDIRLHSRFDRVAVISGGRLVEDQPAAMFAESAKSEEGRRLVAASQRLGQGAAPSR